MNTFIPTKQHNKIAVYSLAYIYIKQVVHQINSWTLILPCRLWLPVTLYWR